ncbi:hypothetical protein ACRQ5D_34200 [Mucilaginibacter sp. P25]|uniref:hypothetical protein n=1 Tax=Mucilaginibacter sp. P25 TaxID=3423945 RepID=UPI003D7982DB
MKQTELSRLLSMLATRSADRAVSMIGGFKATLTRADAYRLYGRSNVDRWVTEGLIQTAGTSGKSSKQIFCRTALERVAASSNRVTYTPVAER